MIVDLKKLDSKDETWQFSTVVYWQGHEWKVKGWRYWPDSGTVKPPSFSAYKRRFALVDFPRSQDEVLAAVRAAIGSANGEAQAGDGKLYDLHRLLLETDNTQGLFAFRRTYPELARPYYIRGLAPEFKELFEDLPEGRLWPDAYLQERASNLIDGVWTVDDLTMHVDLGIFSDADYKRIYQFMGGGK